MDRMSALDAEFLHLEDTNSHLHIAGICVFEPPMPTVEEIRGLVASKLHLLDHYRQRVRHVPLELGRPVWVDDPHFHLPYHVHHTALPSPGGEAELRELMGRLMSQPLDLERPLWETWLVEGLPDQRWALIFKVHHAMVDGIAGVGLLTALLDLDPDARPGDPEPWSPRPEPSSHALVLDAWSGLLSDTLAWAGRLPDAARHPGATLRRAGELGSGLGRLFGRLGFTSGSSIDGMVGPHRVYASSSVPFERVRQVRRALGGTVNDVVLAAVTGGYRDLLVARGEDPGACQVKSLVPVSVRRPGEGATSENRVSMLLLDLPVDVVDPVARLEVVRARMDELKGSHMAEAGELVVEVGDLAPPLVVEAVSRLGLRAQHLITQRSITTVTTNVPGPQFPLYCLGRELERYLPYVPISYGLRIGTAILSYNGTLAFGVTGDQDGAPEVDLLARGIAGAMEALADEASRRA